MWKSTSLILAGFVAGWLLHEFAVQAKVGPTAARDGVNTSQVIPIPVGAKVSAPNTGQPPEIPSVAAEQDIEQQNLNDAALLQAVRFELVNREFSRAIDLCLGADKVRFDECREEILGFADSKDLPPHIAGDLLDLWLLEVPDDIDAGILLVELSINDEQYVQAARRLSTLKSYQVEPAKLERVVREIQAVARAAIIKLTITDDRIGLEALLTILAEMQPERATWHYSLARVQNDLKNYAGAINTLSYILFDPEYGDRATTMYEDIFRKINLSSYSPVPLVSSGPHFLVNARINGSRDVRLLLDTGASITAIDSGKLKQLGLNAKNGRDVILQTAGGVVHTRVSKLGSIDVGGYTLRDLEVASIEFNDDAADGLLGMNFLGRFKFVIDQKQRKLFLTPK